MFMESVNITNQINEQRQYSYNVVRQNLRCKYIMNYIFDDNTCGKIDVKRGYIYRYSSDGVPLEIAKKLKTEEELRFLEKAKQDHKVALKNRKSGFCVIN